MSGIPTPRPSKLAAPGSIARSTTSAISRTAAAPAIAPKKGLKRLNGEEKASDAAIKRARTAMGAPTVGAAKKPVSSSSLASAARKPLATRNTIGSRSNSGSSLNERRLTVAGSQPTTEKPRAAGKDKCKCDQNNNVTEEMFCIGQSVKITSGKYVHSRKRRKSICHVVIEAVGLCDSKQITQNLTDMIYSYKEQTGPEGDVSNSSNAKSRLYIKEHTSMTSDIILPLKLWYLPTYLVR